MKLAVLLGIWLICLIGVHAQSVIQYNSSVPCSEANSCSLTDPSIYLGGIAPNASDEVLINTTANANNTFFFLPSNSTFVVSKLTVLGEGSHLQLNPNSTLAVTEELEFSGFLLWIDADALLGAEEAEITGSLFFIYGLAQIKSLSLEESVISANDNGALFTDEFEFENGSIIFHDESTVFRSMETDFEDSHLVFNNRPFLGDVEFEHVVAFFPNGFFVEDHYVISNSNFSAYFPDELANVTLTLAGHNNLSISNFIFGKTKFNNTGSPFITFNINNNATFNGSIEVPGEIVLGGGSNVVFNGNISLSGGLTADVNDSIQVQAFGFLRCGSPIKLVGHDGRHTFALDSAVLAAPNITVDRFELQVIGRTVLVGDVINNGSIHIFEESALHIHGNYSQESNASLAVYNLNASANRTINVQINGTATLDGHFRYNATETKNKTTVTVLHATSRVGFFASEEYDAASTAGFTPKLVYEANYVNVTITPTEEGTPHKFLGLYWWVWLIIAVGGATLLIAVIVGAVFMRKRSQYEALRTR